jgi:hypothetical protein
LILFSSGLNDQHAKFSDMDEHPDREQRSYSIDHSTDSHAQREPISVLPGGESSILNPDNKYNQDSTFGIGSDDMIPRQKKSMDPRNKDPMIFKPPPPSTRKSISEDSGIGFFGDCNTVSNAPRSRTSLDQASLHRGFISTLPSAQGGRRRRSSAIQRDVPLSDITNIVNNPRDESVTTSAYDNVPIGSSALKSNDMKLSTQSSSDDYNNFLVDRNDMSKSNSYYRSTTENRHDLSDNSFDSELNNNNIPYSAKEVPSNFPAGRTEYAMKPKEKLNVSTGESTHDQDSLGQYAINTHETYVSPGVSGTKAIDKRTENLKGYQTDDSATEDEEETTGKGFFSYATSAAAAVGAGAVAASAAVSNAFFGKPTNDNAIGTQRQVTESQRFSLDDSPSVWKSEDLSSDPNNLYETPIRWGQSTGSKAPPLSSSNKLADKKGAVLNNDQKNDVGDHQTDDFFSSFPDHKTKEESIPHRAYVVPIQDAAISQGNSRLPAVPLKPIDKQKTSLSQEIPTQRKAFTKSKTFAPQVPVSELSKEGSTICLAKNMPRPNEQSHVPYHNFDVPTREQVLLKDAILTPPLGPVKETEELPYQPHDVPTREQAMLKDAILTPPLGPSKPAEAETVPYHAHDVPTREQAMLKDAIITPPPSESIEPEFVEDSPYNVPTKGQSILEKSTSDSPPSQELKNVTGMLPNQLLYTSMPLPDPLKLDQEKPISRPDKLESIEGDTRDKSVPLMNNAVLSDVMPGSFVHSASEDHVSGFEHSNDEDEPAIHGQHACFHTMDIVPPEITPKQVDHSFCGNIKEPSIHGQNPSFYLDEDSNVTGSIRDKSSIGGPADNLNQDEAQTDGFASTNGKLVTPPFYLIF